MGLPKEIAELVERFDRNREAYRSGQYNEMQLRQEFLAPFFEALGWDMNNRPNPPLQDGCTREADVPAQQVFARRPTDYEKIALQRHIDATDRQIDQLVYELYGLTAEQLSGPAFLFDIPPRL